MDVIAVSNILVVPRTSLSIKLAASTGPCAWLLAWDFLTADRFHVHTATVTPFPPGFPLPIYCRDKGQRGLERVKGLRGRNEGSGKEWEWQSRGEPRQEGRKRRIRGRNKALWTGSRQQWWAMGLGMGIVPPKLLTRTMYGCVTDVGSSSITSTEEAPMTGYRMITCPSF